VDCGYCRKLHQEVPEMNKLGIEIRYLAFPRDLPRFGLNGGAGREMVKVWCSSDPAKAMTLAKQGAELPAAKPGCKPPIVEEYKLGQRMGVRGTPAIFNEQGEQIGGYLTAKQAAQVLGLK
ncbi:MAG: thioredoxin fold domain-containing protein, partial [Perlucidibaca sp.]